MNIPITIDGKPTQIIVPDDATDTEIDNIVNAEMGGGEQQPEPAPQEQQIPIDFNQRMPEPGPQPTMGDYAEGIKGTAKGVLRSAADIGEMVLNGSQSAIAPYANPVKIETPEPTEQQQPQYEQGKIAGGIASLALPIKPKIAAGAVRGTIKTAGKAISAIPEMYAKGAESLGLKMQNTTFKLTKPDIARGAKLENIAKYDLWGKPEPVIEKANGQIKALAAQLKEKIAAGTDDPSVYANVEQIVRNAQKNVLKTTSFNRAALSNEFESVMKDLTDKYGQGLQKMDLADVQALKQEAGKLGDWMSVNGRVTGNPEASIKSEIYNSIYDGLKVAVEEKGPEGIKEINRALSELIPLERAASRRLIVSNRNEIIPLKEFMAVGATLATGNIAPLTLVGAQVASKSPGIARAVYKSAKPAKELATELNRPLFEPKPMTKETPIDVSLPEDVNTPTYFRKGKDPDKMNAEILGNIEKAKLEKIAESKVIPAEIKKLLRPQITDKQEMIMAIKRYLRGQEPDYMMGGMGIKRQAQYKGAAK